MASFTVNCRLRRHPHHFKAGQWLFQHIVPAVVLLSLLSCSTFGGSPVYASGASLRRISREARARVAAFFGQLRRGSGRSRTPEGGRPVQERLHRRSQSMHDILPEDIFGAEGPAQEPEGEQTATCAASSDRVGKEEVAVKAKFNLREVHVPEQSPLHRYIPEKESLLLRYREENEEFNFAELRHRRFLGETPHNLWYTVTSEGNKYLLRIPCAPSPKSSRPNTEQITKVIHFGMDASLAVAKRLSREASVTELVERGLGLPLLWGTMLSIPDTFEAAGMICGRSAILYPAMRHTLKDLLSKAQLSDSAMMYLTRAVVRCVAEMHSRQITHNGLSTSSFRIDEKGKVYVFVEYDHSYGGWNEGDAAEGTSKTKRMSDDVTGAGVHVQGAAGVSEGGASAPQYAGAAERKDSLARGSSWAVSQTGLRQLPGTTAESTITHGSSTSGIASDQVAMRPRRKSTQRREASFTFGEQRDSFDLGEVIFNIWCGPPENRPGAHGGRSRTLTKVQRPVSMKNCNGNPPPEVRMLIKKLQGARHSQCALPKDLIITSPLFLDESPQEPSSSTST